MAATPSTDAPGDANMGVTLVSNPICPFAQRAAITLLEKQVPFEQHWIDLQSPPDWFGTISPTGKVPLLKLERAGYDLAVLFESLPICEFIEETWPTPPLHPADTIGRARNRAWMEQVTPMIGDAWTLVTSAGSTTAAETLHARLERMEVAHSGKAFFDGDHFCFVDAVVAPLFRYFEAMPSALVTTIEAGLPRIAGWRCALRERPSVRRAVPDDFLERVTAFNHD